MDVKKIKDAPKPLRIRTYAEERGIRTEVEIMGVNRHTFIWYTAKDGAEPTIITVGDPYSMDEHIYFASYLAHQFGYVDWAWKECLPRADGGYYIFDKLPA